MVSVLAVDLGASSGRGIVYSYENGELSFKEVHRFNNNPIYKDTEYKWDYLDIFNNILKCIKCSFEQGFKISSLSIDTWGVDYGLIKKDGSLLQPPFHYRDKRTKDIIDNFEYMSKKELYSIAGIALNEFNTAYQISKEKTFNDVDTLLFMPNLFAYMLCGKKATEPTIASTSGFYVQGKGFSKEFLDKTNVPFNIMPEVLKTGTVLGKVKKDILEKLDIDADINVVLGCGHDTACAVLSLPNIDDSLFLSSGTWSLFGVLLDSPIVNDVTLKEEYSNEIAYGEKIRLLKNIMGLWIIQQCRNEWLKEKSLSFADIVEECKKVKPLNCYINVLDMVFNDPINMPKKVKDYVKSHENKDINSIGEISRCVYESLALEYRHAYEGIKKITNKEYKRLVIVGGGVNNKFLNQCVANSLNIEVIEGEGEATAFGNALSQLVALKVFENMDEAKNKLCNLKSKKKYIPQDVKEWDEFYKRYYKV